MGLREIYWSATGDPYWATLDARVGTFFQRRVYEAHTVCGYKVKYAISCWCHKVDHNEYKAAQMLEVENRERFVDEWHREVFLKKFRELNYRYELILGHPKSLSPIFSRVVQEGGQQYVYFDFDAMELVREVQEVPFTRYGCRVSFLNSVELVEDGSLIEENYNMFKLRKVDSPENSQIARELEEALVVDLKHRELKLKQEFEVLQSNQQHESKAISVETRRVGNAVEISWSFANKYKNKHYMLRGFRRGDAFALHGASFEEQGMCFVETDCDGKAVQNLEEGKEYYYAFFLVTGEAVYRDEGVKDAILSVVGAPVVKDVQTVVVDSLRFSLRVPTQTEKMRLERMLEKQSVVAVDPKVEKKNKLLSELTAFIEFEECFTEWEKTFVNHINSRGYPPKEQKEKIARLKALIESLRTPM